MAKTPNEPRQDPTEAKGTRAKAKGDKPEESLKRRKKTAETSPRKASPLYHYSVELDPADGFVYGPFALEATDDVDAKRIAIEQYAPALKPKVTKVRATAKRTAEKPINFDDLTDEQKAKLARCREKLGQPALS